MTETMIDVYKKQRRPFVHYTDNKGPHYWTTPAKNALAIARNEMALRKAEWEDRIRFEWEYDQDYEPYGDYERNMLSEGRWEALGCIAYVPSTCPECGHELEGNWKVAASLWGIVVDVDDQFKYKREVERELASEVGVID